VTLPSSGERGFAIGFGTETETTAGDGGSTVAGQLDELDAGGGQSEFVADVCSPYRYGRPT
jgi:hypothetical protein